jgi:hypothetical protein
MFTYIDAQPSRPSLEALFEDYWRLMPLYQVWSLVLGVLACREPGLEFRNQGF